LSFEVAAAKLKKTENLKGPELTEKKEKIPDAYR